jgi:ABC-type cobalamin/Fe3+-siderophores transport system ATPase subunit
MLSALAVAKMVSFIWGVTLSISMDSRYRSEDILIAVLSFGRSGSLTCILGPSGAGKSR